MLFKTILVPYDGSNMSDKTLDKAVEIAKLVNNSKIIIVHVIPEIPTPIFLKEVRSSKTGARITFSEYMESLYEHMEDGNKRKTKRKKREI